MSNNLIIMSKARSILKMYTEGVSKQSISVRTGVTRNTVKKYISKRSTIITAQLPVVKWHEIIGEQTMLMQYWIA